VRDQIGVVIGGSLTKSLEVRLEPGRSAQLGQYLMAPLDDGAQLLGMVTDVLLKSAEAGTVTWPPPAGDDPASQLLRDVLLDTGVYSQVEMNPYLEVGADGANSRARRLPRHFAAVELADQAAMDRAFDTGDRNGISLGKPLGMTDTDLELFVDIERMFERSAGIFGKSGTGKTVYALQFLSALVKHSAGQRTNQQRAVALVFDMHDDYGDYLKFEGGNRRSLKQLHPNDVTIYSLDERSVNADERIVIGTKDITPEDLRVLQATAEFTAAALEAAEVFEDRLKRGWIDAVLGDGPPDALVRSLHLDEEETGDWSAALKRLDMHPGSFQNLRRNLRAITKADFVDRGEGQFSGVLEHIVQTLLGGKSAVVQFGRHGRNLASYMLVANMLSRRIWDAYRAEMERARGDASKEPNRLVIVIEEAHKFVDRSLAGHTIFGQIARELRKYNVTLLVIDQRPSQIDPEVLSQIGTKFCLQLDSESDVEALVGGMQGRAGLRSVIASLESQRQALVFGHALPMPVVVQPPELTPDYRPGQSLRDRLNGGRASEEPTPKGLYG
jgi:DNA helicase HerA-like ATPase